jgi:TonB family protein
MKRTHALPLASLLAALLVAATSAAARSQSPARAGASAARPQAAESAGLTEAAELSRRVVALYTEQKFAEALPLAERALKLREESLGKDDPLVADAAGNVGRVLIALGRGPKAEDHLRRAADIYEKGPAGQSLMMARTLDALASIRRFVRADYAGAADYAARSLKIKESLPGLTEKELISSLYALSELYELSGRPNDAVALHRRVIAVLEKGGDDTLYRLFNALDRFICLTDRLNLSEEAESAGASLIEVSERIKRTRKPLPADTIEGGVINGKALSKPPPAYPRAAISARVSGPVKVWITVDEQGRVVEAVACGHPLLTDAAVRAAYAARFTPTLLAGKPVKVTGTITYNFNLR